MVPSNEETSFQPPFMVCISVIIHFTFYFTNSQWTSVCSFCVNLLLQRNHQYGLRLVLHSQTENRNNFYPCWDLNSWPFTPTVDHSIPLVSSEKYKHTMQNIISQMAPWKPLWCTFQMCYFEQMSAVTYDGIFLLLEGLHII